MYCLKDNLKAKYNQPYFPEKEPDEQAVTNAIRLRKESETEPVEISKLLPRLRPVTAKPQDKYRYYVPKDLEQEASKLRTEWKPSS